MLEKRENSSVKYKVIIAPDTVSQSKKPAIVKLRHPRTQSSIISLFTDDNKSVYEIVAFREKKSSWFINDTVQEDGTLYISSPIDPLYLILPYLKKSKVQPLEDILIDSELHDTHRLLQCVNEKDLTLIADKKGNEEVTAWSYNEDKTLKWLQKKVDNVLNDIKENPMIENAKLYACGLVCEYLEDELAKKLHTYLNLSEEEISVKRKSSSSDLNENSKKTKLDGKKGISTKQKQNQKAAVGSKTITSFFKRK